MSQPQQKSPRFRRVHSPVKAVIAFAALLAALLVAAPAQAQTFTVLHRFVGSPMDGQSPNGGLVRDAAGNLYGTTAGGGAYGVGIVFKIDASGKETILHSFAGPEGANPYSGLIEDGAGNLYGTAAAGGNYACNSPYDNYSCGTVFRLDKAGNLTVLHAFVQSEGWSPTGLIADAAGNLYGTALEGGSCLSGPNSGTIFKIDTSSHFTLLYGFPCDSTSDPPGYNPVEPLVVDTSGNLGAGGHNLLRH